eukprot:4345654-Amphidinium_carterae.1
MAAHSQLPGKAVKLRTDIHSAPGEGELVAASSKKSKTGSHELGHCTQFHSVADARAVLEVTVNK